MQEAALAWRAAGETIAFVPTMGALHEGHIALLDEGRARATKLVLSIFVNPIQFGPNEDYDRYPRPLEQDLAIARGHAVDATFAPTTATMFPEGFQTEIDVSGVSKGLCGEHRPGHFCGVATVVCKLFQIVQPHAALFGEKDYQQLQVIRQMALDLMIPVEIVGVQTVREADGLALSSRNQYLSPAERTQALALNRALQRMALLTRETADAAMLIATGREVLTAAGITRIDYLEIVDAATLQPLTRIDRPSRALVAANVGTTRLIDNIALG
ncbi:MAG: pantoate--beta-alanine ligase [Deltaproteobacteria bacterium]|nr:pantoate--beta-alanine ligase [Deltaproteobacteria bacterium]